MTGQSLGLENNRISGVWLTVSGCVAAGVLAGVITAGVAPFVGFAVLLGLAVLVGFFVSSKAGMITVISVVYLLPFAVIPVPLGSVKLTFLDAAVTLLLVVWLLRLLLNRDMKLINTKIDFFVLLFLGLALASFVFGIDSVSAEMARFFLKTINSILFFFSAVNTIKTRKDLESAVKALVLGVFGAGLIGVILYFINAATAEGLLSSLRVVGYPTTGILRNIADTTTMRAIGTSIDPNVLGGMLMVGVPLIVSQLLSPAPLFDRRLLAVAGAIVVFCLVLTFSRGALAGAAAGIIFLATFRHRKLWLVLVAFVALLFILPQGELVIGRLGSAVAAQDRASQMRLGEYKDALRLISMYPLFGVGFGAAPSIDVYVASASIYLMMAEEMGLIGLAAFLATLGSLFWSGAKSIRRSTDEALKSIQFGAMASVVAALTAGLFDHYFFNLYFPHTIVLFWLFVALTLIASRLGEKQEHEQAGQA